MAPLHPLPDAQPSPSEQTLPKVPVQSAAAKPATGDSPTANVLMVSSEAVPFAKTGGLADVCGALPMALRRIGVDVTLILPGFASIDDVDVAIETTDISFAIEMYAGHLVGGRLRRTLWRDDDVAVPVWFVDQPRYFHRDGLYGPPGGAYDDNAERFLFFCRAVWAVRDRIATFDHDQGWSRTKRYNLLHLNDWQTAPLAGLVAAGASAADHPPPKTVLTVHNLAYQGSFDRLTFAMTGLDWSHYNSHEFEYYGGVNFLKTGLLTADRITTVSRRYAEEICTPEFGCGLDAILRFRSDDLTGIVNGIDTRVWDASADPHLDHHYSADDWREGKRGNRQSVLQELAFEGDHHADDDLPMIGLVGRLADQKGWDLILPLMERWLSQRRPVRWAVLGSGDPGHQTALKSLRRRHPDLLGLRIGFDEGLAHRIEAASDLFLMPSHYEPCGLNQLYSLRYGAVPVVKPVGGLADTVMPVASDAGGSSRAGGLLPSLSRPDNATGFWIGDPDRPGSVTVDDVDAALGRALHMRQHDPDDFAAMVTRGMRQDWSWRRSAAKYADLYSEILTLDDPLRGNERSVTAKAVPQTNRGGLTSQ